MQYCKEEVPLWSMIHLQYLILEQFPKHSMILELPYKKVLIQHHSTSFKFIKNNWQSSLSSPPLLKRPQATSAQLTSFSYKSLWAACSLKAAILHPLSINPWPLHEEAGKVPLVSANADLQGGLRSTQASWLRDFYRPIRGIHINKKKMKIISFSSY